MFKRASAKCPVCKKLVSSVPSTSRFSMPHSLVIETHQGNKGVCQGSGRIVR